ncbi:MAG: SIR2 family protein [Gemmataceae bacterium]
MTSQINDLRIDIGDFLNFYPLRAPQLMWLLGAGASVTSGLPTAYTLTWEFKRQLYCTAHHLPPSRFPNLNDRAFQTRVQSHFSATAGYPKDGDVEEYSFYFHRYLPDEGDRRRFLDARLSGIKPSYGHSCLAALLALGRVEVVWTTNFDHLLERAAMQNVISDRLPHGLTVAGLDCPEKAADVFRDARWPLLVKLHGDFLYRKLKNTAAELQKQDETFRQRLTDQCRQRGLAVVGYSGRDDSVMGALRDALSSGDPFPHGLFWFVRAGDIPSQPVQELLSAARARNCQAGFIETGGFDELMADLFLPYHEELPAVRDIVKAQRERRRAVIPVYQGKKWPVLRTNALEITKYPSSCSVFQADIGGAREVKEAIGDHRGRVAAGRRQAGIVAFGTRADLTNVFAPHNPREFERYPIEWKRLLYDDSIELGLFYDAVCHALSNQTGLCRSKNHKGRLLYLPSTGLLKPAEQGAFKALNIVAVRQPKARGPLVHEGFFVNLEYCDKRLWLLLEPSLMITTDGTTPYTAPDRSDIGREDLVRRYNRQASSLLTTWIDFLTTRCGSPIKLGFPTLAEPEAEFEVCPVTAYSRHVQ